MNFPELELDALYNSVRRLQTVNETATLQCLAGCPTMLQAGIAMQNLSSANGTLAQMQLMCPHEGSITCMLSNSDCNTLFPALAGMKTMMTKMWTLCKTMPGSDVDTCVNSCTGSPANCTQLEGMLTSGCAKDCSSESKIYFRVMAGGELNCTAPNAGSSKAKPSTDIALVNYPGLGALLAIAIVWMRHY